MRVLFISDLHLQPQCPHGCQLFSHFLECLAPQAEVLYILGDLFEYWVGDDHNNFFIKQMKKQLHALGKSDTALKLMVGNRDFLLGQEFATAVGATLLTDPTCIDLFGKKTLLMHGDSLCSNDKQFMAYLQKIRDPLFQKRVLAYPLWLRLSLAKLFRLRSRFHNRHLPREFFEVNYKTLQQLMVQHQAQQVIHGHIHRPGIHLSLDFDRYVLSDWRDQGNYLLCSDNHSPQLKYVSLTSRTL